MDIFILQKVKDFCPLRCGLILLTSGGEKLFATSGTSKVSAFKVPPLVLLELLRFDEFFAALKTLVWLFFNMATHVFDQHLLVFEGTRATVARVLAFDVHLKHFHHTGAEGGGDRSSNWCIRGLVASLRLAGSRL